MIPPTKAMLELADRIDATKHSWLPIAGHVVNITISLADADAISTALRSSQNNGDSGERERVIEGCARCVPTNWTDVLLTGPEAPKGNFDARAIEQLLRGIQDRIRALKSGKKGSVERVHPDVPPYGDQS